MEEVLDAALIANEPEALVDEQACDCPGRHSRVPPMLRQKLGQCREVPDCEVKHAQTRCVPVSCTNGRASHYDGACSPAVFSPPVIPRAWDRRKRYSPPDGDPFVTRIVRTLARGRRRRSRGRHRHGITTRSSMRSRASAVAVPACRPQSRSVTRSVVVTARRHGRRRHPSDRRRDVTLVDVPLVALDGHAVIDAWRRTRAPIVRPAIGDRTAIRDLRSRGVRGTASCAARRRREIRRARARGEILNVPVDDEGC